MSRKFKHNAKSFHARIIKKKVKKKNKIKNPKCNLFVCDSWLWIISVMIAGVNSEVIDEVLIHLLVIREHKSKYHRICRFLLQLPLDWPIIIVGPCIFFLSSDSFGVENEGKNLTINRQKGLLLKEIFMIMKKLKMILITIKNVSLTDNWTNWHCITIYFRIIYFFHLRWKHHARSKHAMAMKKMNYNNSNNYSSVKLYTRIWNSFKFLSV